MMASGVDDVHTSQDSRMRLCATIIRNIIQQGRTQPLLGTIAWMPSAAPLMRSASSRSPSPPAKRIKLDNAKSAPIAHTRTSDPGSIEHKPVSDAFEPPQNAEAGPSKTLEQLVEDEMSAPIDVPVEKYEKEIDYTNKLVLAPMVRTGTLPTRLLALHYGAGLVWGPEIVDRAIIGATRMVDAETGVITYTKKGGDGKPIFQCHPVEKPFLIYQIGTSDPDLAVQAAKTVQQDVAGFDLNCGCPKPFSVHSGMGAALLSTPEILLNILRALIREIPLPISCKIRLLPEQPNTLHLVSRILRTGIRCLTVHCRTRSMRSTERAMWERLRDVVRLGERRKVPIVCNGDGEGWANWETIRKETGVTSVMIARAAESNPSIFLPTGPLSTCEKLIPEAFLPLCAYLRNHYSNTKFLLYQHKPSPAPISKLSKAERKVFSDGIAAAKSEVAALELWKLEPDEARQKGRIFMRELEVQLRARDGSGYPEDFVTEDPHRAVVQGTNDVATTEAKAEGKDVFDQHAIAKPEGRVVEAPSEEEHAMAPISREDRPRIVGPDDHIEPPFPLRMEGKVEKGFGRGSKELGIPTANLPYESIHPLTSLNLTGIYYGFARIHPTTGSAPNVLSSESISKMAGVTAPYPQIDESATQPEEGANPRESTGEKHWTEADSDVWPMVMSVGWNPYYKNEKLTAEVHIMHQFPTDFYGHHMSVLVLGYIRPELNYVSKDALIEDINTDVKVALASLARPVYAAAAKDTFFSGKVVREPSGSKDQIAKSAVPNQDELDEEAMMNA